MIYISKNNHVEIFTDNLVDFIPDILDVYLDDVLIGSFDNLSDNTIYLRFIVPVLTITEKEYTMKIFNHKALIKQELVIVKYFTQNEVKSITTTKELKMYE